MRVAVTGASGMLGRSAVKDLLAAGHEVFQLDRVVPQNQDAPYRVIDILDLGQVCGAFHGCDAVLHLAAIPTLSGQAYEVVFRTNVMGTFNVLEAAALLGIQRVVTISSCSALGVAYRFHQVDLLYVPVDEAHPLVPQDAYGLSKQVGEDLCRSFHRRTGGAAISMRFPWICDDPQWPKALEGAADNEEGSMSTLWSYIDVRDAARACRLALETPGLTDEAFYVTAPETFMRETSGDLARRHFATAEIRADPNTYWSFHDCSLAERVLGFKAEYTWRP